PFPFILSAIEIEDVALLGLSGKAPGPERRELDAAKPPKARDTLQRHRRQFGRVVPAENEMPAMAQARMALRESRFALRARIETPTINAVAQDEIEHIRREEFGEALERRDHMMACAVAPRVVRGLDRPECLPREIGFLIVPRVPLAAHEQHRAHVVAIGIVRKDHLLEDAAVFGAQGRAQPQGIARDANDIGGVAEEPQDAFARQSAGARALDAPPLSVNFGHGLTPGEGDGVTNSLC